MFKFRNALGCAALLTLCSLPARATLNCSFTAPTINFGAVDVLSGIYTQTTASMTMTCTKAAGDVGNTGNVCLFIGDGSGADPVRGTVSTTYAPRFLVSGTNYAGFQIYTDPGYSTFWGTFAPNPSPQLISFTFTGGSRTYTAPVVFYAQMAAISPALNGTTTLQSIVPGAYASSFSGGHTLWYSTLTTNQTVDTHCNPRLYSRSGNFPFSVSATVNANCLVNSVANINFGTQASIATNLQGSTSLSVQCTRTTPYYIGLQPSNGSLTGAGVMSSVANPLNTDQVPYQLRQTAGMSGTIWGNTATSSSAGNGRGGMGTGVSTQSYTIYATVPTANYSPDDYKDIVTVTVNF